MSRVFNSGYEGELLRFNHATKSYQPRYFAINLSTSTLHYYTSTQMQKSTSPKTPCGSFKLANCLIFADENCPVSFTIHTFVNDNQKSCYLKAGSGDERTTWLNALELGRIRSEITDRSMNSTLSTAASSYMCSICLETARQPSVTQCGHLFCMNCIYRWVGVGEESTRRHRRACPVCNKSISKQQIVRIYGVDDLDSTDNNISYNSEINDQDISDSTTSNNSEIDDQDTRNRMPRKLFAGIIDVGEIGYMASEAVVQVSEYPRDVSRFNFMCIHGPMGFTTILTVF